MTERAISSSSPDAATSSDTMPGFTRLPGFIRRWELPQVTRAGVEFVLEEAGKLDGVDLFRVFHRTPAVADANVVAEVAHTAEANDCVITGSLLLDGESTPLPARLLPISAGDPLMAVVVVEGRHRESAILKRVREHLEKTGACKSGETSGSEVASARGSMRGHR